MSAWDAHHRMILSIICDVFCQMSRAMEVGQHAPEVEAAEASDEDVDAYIGKATGVVLIYLLLFLNNIYRNYPTPVYYTKVFSVLQHNQFFMTKFLIQNIPSLVMHWLLTKNKYCSFFI